MIPTLCVALATIAIAFSIAGAFADASAPRAPGATAVGGPYRAATLAPRAPRVGVSLVAVGGGLLGLVEIAALSHALLTLRWEGIGVSLLPGGALACARILDAWLPRDPGRSRTIANAALVLDVPLGVFALVHLSADGPRAEHALSLAAVAAAFALLDGLQSVVVMWSSAPREPAQ